LNLTLSCDLDHYSHVPADSASSAPDANNSFATLLKQTFVAVDDPPGGTQQGLPAE